ncbi:MAG: flagellar motor switch protein FliG [Candidatus Limnocylindrales bacterium]|jgi:flagellar motor switch protein FliG
MSSEAAALTLSGPRKAAALLITLGTEASAKLLARLPPDALDRVALELMRMPAVDSSIRDAILEEAYAGLFAHAGVLPGGENYALELFGQAFGQNKAHELVERVQQAQQIIPFDFMRDIDPVQAAGLLSDEHPQTVAIVLAHLDPRNAARILTQLEPPIQVEVAKRIALTEQITPEAVQIVEEGLRRKLSSVVTEVTSVGGARPLAHVLNQVGRTNERQILTALSEQDSQLADEVRRYMFVFDDIILLDDRAMQRVIRELDAKDMALALRPATEQMRLKFFQNMSQRAAEMLREEMSLAGQVRMKAAEEAQQRVIDSIKKLEDNDEITINRGGSEDALV